MCCCALVAVSCRSLIVVRCLLRCGVCCVRVVVVADVLCALLGVDCCWYVLFAVRWCLLLFVGCCVLCVVCCLLNVCCLFIVVG